MLQKARTILLRSLDLLTLLLDDDPRRPQPDRRTRRRSVRQLDAGASPFAFRPKISSRPRGAPPMMARVSAQGGVDRVVSAAAVVALSAAFLRWLSSRDPNAEAEERGGGRRSKNSHGWMPWRWTAIALDWWNTGGRKEDEFEEVDDDDEYEHQGSCHCGSIKFSLGGPKNLRTLTSPGKIGYPHVPIPADRFRLLRGESDMRFFYEEGNDDSSSITFELVGKQEEDDAGGPSGAQAFCGNCGVHVFHADRCSGMLEVSAKCLNGGWSKLIYKGVAPRQGKLERSQSSVSSISGAGGYSAKQPARNATIETNNSVAEQLGSRNATIETVSETEQFLGSAHFLPSIDDGRNGLIPRKESLSSEPTQSETNSATLLAEFDDLSVLSSSITGVSLPMHHSSLSVASGAASPRNTMDRTHYSSLSAAAPPRHGADRAGLPPLPSSRISPSRTLVAPEIPSSDVSVKTMPPLLAGRHGYRGIGASGGGRSVASREMTYLDAGNLGKTTISPRMRDQMKRYMGRHMSRKEPDEKMTRAADVQQGEAATDS